jgi:hypothetical protein
MFVFLLVGAALAVVPREKMTDDLRNCAFDRNEAARCAEKYGDIDGDRAVNATEVRILMDNVLQGPIERTLAFFFPVSHVMSHCDVAPVDGKITEADFDASLVTCLATCDRVTKFMTHICDVAKRMHYNPRKH